MTPAQPVVVLRLPAMSYRDRLTIALQHWERRHGRVGLGGNQAFLFRQLVQRFGSESAAPSAEAVGTWIRGRAPSGPNAVVFAATLGVPTDWLLLGHGEPFAPLPDDDPRDPDEADAEDVGDLLATPSRRNRRAG